MNPGVENGFTGQLCSELSRRHPKARKSTRAGERNIKIGSQRQGAFGRVRRRFRRHAVGKHRRLARARASREEHLRIQVTRARASRAEHLRKPVTRAFAGRREKNELLRHHSYEEIADSRTHGTEPTPRTHRTRSRFSVLPLAPTPKGSTLHNPSSREQ